MVDINRILLSGVFWATVLTAGLLLGGGMAQSQEAVTVSFTTAQPSLSLYEPVILEFAIHNGLTEGIRFDLGYHEENNFEFTVTEPNRSVVRVPRIMRGGISRAGIHSLAPNETYTLGLVLNEWYEFSRPGDYKVKAKLLSSIQTQSGMPVEAKVSQVIGIHIDPRDPKRLDELCRNLAKAAVGTSDAESAMQAASTLSYVRDPVAVPYLGQVLREGFFGREIAIKGLVRIGNSEAVEVLKSNLNTPDAELRALIQGALEKIGKGIHPQVMD